MLFGQRKPGTNVIVSQSILPVRTLAIFAYAAVCVFICARGVFAQEVAQDRCPRRPAIGSMVGEPEDLRSRNGVLRVDLTFRNSVDAKGHLHYCYLAKDGTEAPTLRLKPGDLLILRLKNEVVPPPRSVDSKQHMRPMVDKCGRGEMTIVSTNLHFHGITVPPVCHQDDVLNTMIQPGDPPFEYRFKIPADEPPGLYWYHPHVHGLTKGQVLGGASGALIVEGIERATKELAGLPERVMIIRDQDLVNPDAAPGKADAASLPPALLDAEGDAMNTGTGGGKPAKDLSINFVPVPYPGYPPAVIGMRPGEAQLWRVLNASAITYLNLQVLLSGGAQALGVVALDGVPINRNGTRTGVLWQSHLGVPPGGRIEFIVKGPAEGAKVSFVTRGVNTGAGGENDPERPLATVVVSQDTPETGSRLSTNPVQRTPSASTWLGDLQPVRTRKLYFSEKLQNPSDPGSATEFYITVDGETPKAFDPNSTIPDITVLQGDVEDWIIENRTQELHAFHVHQIHFMLLQWFGLPVDEPFLRDTIDVPFWDGKNPVYPMVKLRMDFRDPNAVGTFVYHCHLLEHEDAGMMGVIRVLPRSQSGKSVGAEASARRPLCGVPRLGIVSREADSRGAKNVKSNVTAIGTRSASF